MKYKSSLNYNSVVWNKTRKETKTQTYKEVVAIQF